MCASAGLNMQTTDCGFCSPRWATARVAARRECVIGPAWRSRTSVALSVSPCHAARRCSSWSGLQTSAGGLTHPGSSCWGRRRCVAGLLAARGPLTYSRPGCAPAASRRGTGAGMPFAWRCCARQSSGPRSGRATGTLRRGRVGWPGSLPSAAPVPPPAEAWEGVCRRLRP